MVAIIWAGRLAAQSTAVNEEVIATVAACTDLAA